MNDFKAGLPATGAKGRLRGYLRAVFDVRSALIVALVMATLVWLINIASTTPRDILGATTAALKQGSFTFIFGGFFLRLVAWMAARPGKPAVVVFFATLIPGSLSVGSNYLVHSLRGTPSPFLSTLPILISTLIFTPVWAFHQNRKASSAHGTL